MHRPTPLLGNTWPSRWCVECHGTRAGKLSPNPAAPHFPGALDYRIFASRFLAIAARDNAAHHLHSRPDGRHCRIHPVAEAATLSRRRSAPFPSGNASGLMQANAAHAANRLAPPGFLEESSVAWDVVAKPAAPESQRLRSRASCGTCLTGWSTARSYRSIRRTRCVGPGTS